MPGVKASPDRPSAAEGSTTDIELIKGLYEQGPHAALYAPLCKVRPKLESCQHLVSTDGQRLSAVLSFAGDSIEFTWSLAGRALSLRNLIAQAQHRMGRLAFVPVMETGRKSWSALLGLPVLGRYFRATLADDAVLPDATPPGYAFSNFDPDRDLEAASRLMNAAYPSLRQLMTPEKLRRMAQAPYYTPRSWFFLVESSSSQPVGFAIHGYCAELQEGFIDWIEVIPRLRHRGFGSLLTYECVRRMAGKSRFITTSGSLDAPFVHGDLYKKCGFDRIRQWTILGQARLSEDRGDIFTVPPGHPSF